MTATQKTNDLRRTLDARTDAVITFEDANTLRRAERTLHRWAELECGDSDQYANWAIERDEKTGKPWMVRHPHNGPVIRGRTLIADREKGALRRVEAICKRLGLYYYHQTDPRGCALYVASTPLSDTTYTNGVACCV